MEMTEFSSFGLGKKLDGIVGNSKEHHSNLSSQKKKHDELII